MGQLIEIAKSGRAACRICGAKIKKGEHRLGVEYDSEYGTSHRWHHLACAATKLPAELAAALSSYAGELPEREQLLATIAEASKAAAAADASPGVSYPRYPSASLAPTSRASCAECGEAIAKGEVRVEIEHEVEINGRMREAVGYLHPACAPRWAARNWTGTADFAETLRHNAAVSVPEAAFASYEAPERAPRPPFPGVDEVQLQRLARALGRARDVSGYRHKDVLRDAVAHDERTRLLWYMARHELIDAGHDPGIWSLLADEPADFELDAALDLLCQIPGKLSPLFGRGYRADYLIPNWCESLQRIAVLCHHADRERLRERLPQMHGNVRLGVCLVFALRGDEVPSEARKALVEGLAKIASTAYPEHIDDVETSEPYPEQSVFDPAPIARALDAETWRDALRSGVARHRWRDASLVHEVLVELELPALLKTLMRADGGDLDAASFEALIEARGDAGPALITALMAVPEDDRGGGFERFLTVAMARSPGQVPAGAEDLLDFLAMNPSLSTGEEAVPRYRRALTALGDARVDALAARLLDSRMSSRAAAPLSLRFDADSYAKIFTADDAYLSPMWLALPGLAALPTLLRELDSPRAGDQKKRIADALPLALLQAARDGERIDVELLARLELGDRDELSHSLCEALTVVLPAVDAKALARHVRDQLEAEAPASRPEQLLWVASFVEDPGVHELAVKTVIERRADIRALGLVKQAVTRLGDAALPLFERHIAISQGDRTFLGQLESVFPPPAVEALGAAQGLAKETSLQTMQRLAKAGRDHRRVYAFDLYAKLSPPRDGSLSCYDGPPPAGVEVPLRAGEPMDHVLTIDLQDAPELAALAGHEGARTLSFFLGERHEDELVEDSELVPCAAPGALHPEARPFAIVPLDLPGGVFARRTDNPELQQLRKLLFNCDGYALGEPIWIQSPEPMGTFLFQLSESFGLNLGDSGEMYVWAGGEANWQCY